MCATQKISGKKKILKELKRGNDNPNLQLRTKTGLLNWHNCKARKFTRTLFRLRTGHNRLNGHLSRFNKSINPNCQDCHRDEETAEHVLLQCTSWIPERGEINHYFHTHNIQPELTNLLGLNPSFPSKTQFNVTRLLVKYLRNTRIIYRI